MGDISQDIRVGKEQRGYHISPPDSIFAPNSNPNVPAPETVSMVPQNEDTIVLDDEQDIDINDILDPENAKDDYFKDTEISFANTTKLSELLNPKLNWELQLGDTRSMERDFILYHPYPRPPLNDQPEFYSSKDERIQLTKLRQPNMVNKKRAHKRMRLIILVDIVLFIVILGIIYPSLRKIQSGGRLDGYRFSLSQSLDLDQSLLNIVIKIEKLATSQAQVSKDDQVSEFSVDIISQGHTLLQDFRRLPQIDTPVSYALFSIPYRQFLINQEMLISGLDIVIGVNQDQKKFYLQVPKLTKK